MADEDNEIFYKLMKAGAKQAVKKGAAKVDLPDDVSRFLASQLSFTFDMVKKAANSHLDIWPSCWRKKDWVLLISRLDSDLTAPSPWRCSERRLPKR
jgi:hypothetical protein